MSRYFIDRPIFAWVLAILVMLAGIIALRGLPIAQFPSIAAPTVSIVTLYPGADAETLERTTTQVIEQQLKGIDNLRYFSSSSDSAGNITISLTFEQGTDVDIAQVQVQNKLAQATPLLPQEVQRGGLAVVKSTGDFLLIAAAYSDNGVLDQKDLGDVVSSTMRDPISRIKGVGNTELMGAPYAMRIWIDPYKMANLNVSVPEVIGAIQAQNAQISAGQIGSAPAVQGQALNATVTARSRLTTPEEFQKIIVRGSPDGSAIYLEDVAKVELGADSYTFQANYNGHPAAALGIKLAPGANALDTASAVKAEIERLKTQVPDGVKIELPVDRSEFIRISVLQVVKTLLEAIVLVFLVMFLFLQNWRATIIPTIAVPVVLMGALAILYASGFIINTLTLFGMVLAIGLLVDDAIVVVENVERLIQEEGLSPKEASYKSMDEISGALIGIGLVLSAVFLPMAFFGGSTGVIFRQFSITIVATMALSVLVALILTPALCATLLKPAKEGHHQKGRFFTWFNNTFDRSVVRYEGSLRKVERNWRRSILVYFLIVIGMAFLFVRMPSGFLPQEDAGSMFTIAVLPAGTTLEETERTMASITDYYMKEEPNVASVFTVAGFGFGGQSQNTGTAFVKAKHWDERKGSGEDLPSIMTRANENLAKIGTGMILAIVPPPITEMGTASGFEMQLMNTGNVGRTEFLDARNMLLGMAAQDPRLMQVRPDGVEDAPQMKLIVDEVAASTLGVPIADINSTIATGMGGTYINDFVDRGRVKRVYVQSDAEYRANPEALENYYVPSTNGGMVPFSAFATTEWIYGPMRLERFNGISSLKIVGLPAPGVSTGEAMDAIGEIAAKLPPGVGFEFSGISYEEQITGGQAPMLYALSLLIVFLCLAALYESWSIPIAVILVVPLGVLGAVLAATFAGLNNDIYLQVGLVTTIGVAAKNAILIVEFAEEKMREGLSAADAAIEAAKLRLRPILMTSFAFVGGVIPLAISTGAGAGGQNAIGWAVVGGMLSATVLAIFFVPLFFFVVKRLLKQDIGQRPKPSDVFVTANSQEA